MKEFYRTGILSIYMLLHKKIWHSTQPNPTQPTYLYFTAQATNSYCVHTVLLLISTYFHFQFTFLPVFLSFTFVTAKFLLTNSRKCHMGKILFKQTIFC